MDAQNYIRCVCEGCNTEFEAVRPKRYCTRKCNKAAIRKNKTSVSRAEYVANMRENAASKFTCECCGIEAFRTMSGTNKAKGFVNRWCSMICRSAAAAERARLGGMTSNAPELDHRTPLSKGGGHLYSNVQCACRSCNIAKGNGSEVGQLPLLLA